MGVWVGTEAFIGFCPQQALCARCSAFQHMGAQHREGASAPHDMPRLQMGLALGAASSLMLPFQIPRFTRNDSWLAVLKLGETTGRRGVHKGWGIVAS